MRRGGPTRVIGLPHYLLVGSALFGIGAFGALTRRNAIAVLLSVELMLNAANLNFLAFWRFLTPTAMEPHVGVLVGLAVAAAEAAIGLAIVLSIYREFGTVNLDKIAELKG
ncbi:MAG: NADH-quinone oxidoreductase subunit NuoK [Armatimonadetes bacterium]|nr:NADH-quinone oxidoreductase subunit NuoK [Armatimonadota bacterium]